MSRAVKRQIVTDHPQVVNVIQNEQPVVVLHQPSLDSGNYLVLVRDILLRQVEPSCQSDKIGVEHIPVGRSGPEDRLIAPPIPMSIFDNGLGLANTAESTNSHNLC